MTLDAVVGLAGGLAASIAVARVLGPRQLGYYSYLLWAMSAVTAAAAMGVPAAAQKYAAEAFGAGGIQAGLGIIRRTWRIQSAISGITAAAALAVVAFVVPPQHRFYAAIGAASIAPAMLMEIPTSANAAAQRYGATVIPSIIAAIVNLAGIALSLASGWGLPGLAGSLLASRLADLALRRSFFARVSSELRSGAPAGPAPPGPDLVARMRRFCLHSAALQILNLIVWDRSEVFFLERYRAIQDVAFYAMPFNITTQALVFARAFSSTAGVNLMTKAGSRTDAAKAQAAVNVRYLALFMLPVLLGLAALSGPLIRTLYGTAYSPAVPVLALLGLFAVARAVLAPLLIVLAAFEAQVWAVRVTLGCALLNIALDFLLIPAHGPLGAALANGIAQSTAVFGIWMCVTHHAGIDLQSATLVRVAAAAAGAVIPAAVLSLVSPAWFAIGAGVACGAALYPLLIRAAGAMQPGDRLRMAGLIPLLPRGVRGAAGRLLYWITPSEA